MSDSKCDLPPTYSATGDGSLEESKRQLAVQQPDAFVPSAPPCGMADGPSSSQHLLYNYPPQDISAYYPPPCLLTVVVEPCPPPYSLEQPGVTRQVQPMVIVESTRNTPKHEGTDSYFSFTGAICLSCFNICCCIPGLLCGLAAFFTAGGEIILYFDTLLRYVVLICTFDIKVIFRYGGGNSTSAEEVLQIPASLP